MRVKVLVVDDEPLAREGLKLLLGRQAGVESVSEARNGREAIAIIRERPPDLVLLDVQMPRMDGFAVVHAVGPERMPAVIFVTATTSTRSARSRSPRSTTCSSRSPRSASPSRSSGRPAGSGCAARRDGAPGRRDARSDREPAPAAHAVRGAVRRADALRAR